MESPISFFNEDVKYILKNKNAIREWITSGVKKEFENAMKFDDPPVVKNESLKTILDTKTEVVNSTEIVESKRSENTEIKTEENRDSTANPVN